MMAIAALCEIRIKFSCLLIGGDLDGGVEKGVDLSDRRFHGVVDLVQSTCVRGLVLEASDQFKGSMATTSALGIGP
jgi:hypothetical protein